MNIAVAAIAVAVFSYLLGGIPSAYVICKVAKKIDIREIGSGNVGATNVFRVFGWRLALMTAIVDVLKGFIPVMLTIYFLPQETRDWFMILAAIFSVLGHSYSPMLRLSGGKGIATSAGALLAMIPFSMIQVTVVFVAVIWIFRKVSLGSLLAALFLPITVMISYPDRPVILVFSFLLTTIIFWRHKSNIGRLINGTENEIDFSKISGIKGGS